MRSLRSRSGMTCERTADDLSLFNDVLAPLMRMKSAYHVSALVTGEMKRIFVYFSTGALKHE